MVAIAKRKNESQKVTAPRILDARQDEAAVMLASGEYTVDQVAEHCGVDRRQIFRWKAWPEFNDRIAQTLETFHMQVMNIGVANVVTRMMRYQRRANQINGIFEARSKDPAYQGVPGGETGLLVHEQVGIGLGANSEIVDRYKPDTALLKEERELYKQAAIEAGQWTEQTRHEFANMTDAELINQTASLFGRGEQEEAQTKRLSLA